MKKLRNYVISLTVMATLFLCPLSAFAYEPISDTWTLQSNSWKLKFFDAAGKNTFESSAINITSSENRYHFTNSKSSSVYGLSFGHENYQFDFPYIPEMYDYFIYVTVHSAGGTTGEYFSFVPERATIDEKDCSSGVGEQHYLETIAVRHYDDNNQVGFAYLGKLPDNIHNGAMRYFNFYDWGGGSVGANLYLAGSVIAIPKNNSNSSVDHSTIVSLLSQILEYDELTYVKLDSVQDLLMDIRIMLFEEGKSDFDDIEKSEDTEQIGDLNEAEKELIGDTSYYEQSLDITINPTATKVVWDSVDSFVQGNGKVFAMFITLLSLGFIKLVLNR